MRARIISSIVLLPIVIFMLYYGGLPLAVFLCAATLIGLYEFYKAVHMDEILLKILTAVFTMIAYIVFYKELFAYLNLVMLIFVVLCLSVYALKYPRISLSQLSYVGFACIYIVYLMLHIAMVRSFGDNGHWFVWLIFIIAFGSDSSAYFAGVTLGKHPLVPKLSPKKTIEGSVGGVIGAGLLTVGFGYFMTAYGPLESLDKLWVFFFVGAVGSAVSQIGDLVGSAMKRQTEIKDFGKIIPGHGGILDRLDSILLTAPYVYLVMRVLF